MPNVPRSLARGLVFLLAWSVGLATASPLLAALPGETQDQKNQRMAWWREAKFGMFIHWGLYSVAAGQWKGKEVPGAGEWILRFGKLPEKEYALFQHQFNPTKYDPAQWVSLAKRAGMKYIVITTKHHDGFCLFDSKLTDYDVMNTPHGRDLLKPLAEECRRQDVKLCFYHSIIDWHRPDARGKRFPEYVQFMQGQLRELLTNYGDVGLLWFDGQWIKEWNEDYGRQTEKLVRRLQPNVIVNNRVGKSDWNSGDYGTPEQKIPKNRILSSDWETCMTMNKTWGFKKNDHAWKSSEDLIRKLVDIAHKGGNFLLNVGPTPEGLIPEPSVERLEAMGRWLDVNGQSIYGTTASPFEQLAWGRCTQKPGRLFLHVFDWPKDGRLVVPGLQNQTGKAYLLADRKQGELKLTRSANDVAIELPAKPLDPIDTVVVLEIVENPNVSSK